MDSNYMMLTYQVILKISSIHSFVILSALLLVLSLWHHTTVFANHGQEISLTLNSAQFLPLSSAEGNQVNLVVNYSAVNSTILGQTINAVMKVYAPNTTAIKSTSFPNGFTANSSGTQELKTTITDNQIQNVTAVVQFTDAARIAPISNPMQVNLSLTRPTLEYVQAEEVKAPEIAALP
ncbi:MAG: hypothetical protein ACR2IS_12095 [Nitrososphaeraceae archaeon]